MGRVGLSNGQRAYCVNVPTGQRIGPAYANSPWRTYKHRRAESECDCTVCTGIILAVGRE